MFKIILLSFFLQASIFADECHDLSALYSILKLKDTITAKSHNMIETDEKFSRNLTPVFSIAEVCEDSDIIDNLNYMKKANYDKSCNLESVAFDLDYEGKSANLNIIIEERFGRGASCNSQEFVELETHLRRLVRRVRPQFEAESFGAKNICNTVRKALPKLRELMNNCS